MIKDYRLGFLKSRNILFYCFMGWKFGIKVLVGGCEGEFVLGFLVSFLW